MPDLVMLIGLPASGKSTLAEEYRADGYVIHSSDALRMELFGSLEGSFASTDIFTELHERIKKDLSVGNNVVYDATNLSHKRRKAFLGSISHIPCHKKGVLVLKSLNKCIEDDSTRKKKVGARLIVNMAKQFEPPFRNEEFNELAIVQNFTEQDWEGLEGLDIPQCNPHHTLSISKHCQKVADTLDILGALDVTACAGLYHDIGKRLCMSFIDAKGRECKNAHFYGHEAVGAYKILMCPSLSFTDALCASRLISLHGNMIDLTEKSKAKKIAKLGEDWYHQLELLHIADMGAK